MGDEIICIVRMKAVISHVHEENSKQNEEQAFLLSRGEGGFAHPVIRFLVEEAEFGIFLPDLFDKAVFTDKEKIGGRSEQDREDDKSNAAGKDGLTAAL